MAPDITLFPIQQTMPSPLISVIVPIYNMESLLPRCLDSLAAQTLRDLEIICVDDGSTDGSGGIVRKYASGDSRFRLITQENSGRAEARNAGIRAAAAPYLGFADPDDYVEPDMYERLYRLAEESGADMVQCSYSPFLPAESGESRGMAEEKLLHIENTACDGVFTEKGEIFRLFLEDRITGVVWSKLFRRILPGCSAPWKSACLLPSPAEKTPFTFPGPSPVAAASPSPLKNSTTTGWAVPNPFLLATGKRKPGPQVITPYSRCSPGKNSGKGFWAATARPT